MAHVPIGTRYTSTVEGELEVDSTPGADAWRPG